MSLTVKYVHFVPVYVCSSLDTLDSPGVIGYDVILQSYDEK